MHPSENFSDLGLDPKLKPYGPRPARFAFRWPGYDAWLNVLVGSVRSSKTWATFPKILWLCQYPVLGHRVITGVSKQSIFRNVLSDLFEIVGEANYTYNRQSGELTLFGTKWLVIGAKDEGSEKYIRGITIGVAVCDEVVLMPRNFFLMLLSRMSPAGARFYATTNPDSPFHWFKSEVLENPRYVHGLGKDLWVQTWTMKDNPNLAPEFRERVERSYTGVFYQRYILGLWVLAEGAIYRDVLTDDVFYDDASRPAGLLSEGGHVEHWLVVDYGTANALAAIDTYDDSTTVWMDREYYYDSRLQGRQKTDGEYASDLINFVNERMPLGAVNPRLWPGVIIDPSAASFRAELLSRGFYVIDADNEVEDGIRRVSTMLTRKKLRINRQGCPQGVRFMQSYCWNEKKIESGQEQPLKKHDHWPDACRYYVKTRINDWRLAA